MKKVYAIALFLGMSLWSNSSYALTLNVSAVYGVPGSGAQYDYSFAAGTYTASLVNPAIDDDASYWAWNYTSGWLTGWGASIGASSGYDIWGGLGGPENGKDSPELAYAAAATAGKLITSFTLPQESILHFYVLDNITSDNLGGVSLDIKLTSGPASVPEPSTFLLLGGGLASLAFVSLRLGKK